MAEGLVLTSIQIGVIWLYHVVLSGMPKIVELTDKKTPPEMLFYVLIGLMFIPEIVLIISREFRGWIKRGIEDDDGKFNKSDLKDMVVLYVSLWSLRVFMVFSWVRIFYDVHIEFHIYVIPLLGSFGIASIPILKSFLPGKG